MSGLLTDEKEVRLNDLMRACRKAAEHYHRSVDVLEQDPAGAFKHLAESRNDLCRATEALIRSCGYLPETLDPDRQTVANLTQRAKAYLAGEERTTLLKHAAHLEDDLTSCIRSVLELSWPPAQQDQLRRMDKDVMRGRQMIEAMIDSDPLGGSG
jgi:hypothetical protein